MKLSIVSISLAAVTLLSLGTAAEAAKPGKGKGKRKAAPGRILGRFDRDQSGKIDGKELTQVQGLYEALATLDTDKDGKLSESEVAGVTVQAPKRAKKKSQ